VLSVIMRLPEVDFRGLQKSTLKQRVKLQRCVNYYTSSGD